MLEEILKHRPKGATHWDVGTYYKKDGDKWFYWDRLWFRVADISTLNMWMTTLPEEKEPAMIEFEGKSGKWAWEIQKEQQANLVELRSSIENLVQKYKHDAHASSLFGDQDKARVYNCFANQLKNLLKGGA
ncbi:TPA: hypothetical protein JI037_15110 [Acinetobacter baumannii]|nr:hypothetical protein [Acinetobacter baumannii]HAV5358575.1 hypothetical protein [Acinetobacter baumannii]